MVKQKTFEYDNSEYLEIRKGFLKKETKEYFYHMRIELNEEKQCLILEQTEGLSFFFKDKLVRQKIEIQFLPIPEVKHSTLGLKITGHCFYIRSSYVDITEYDIETGEELKHEKGYRTIYCTIPIGRGEEFIDFIQQKIPIPRR